MPEMKKPVLIQIESIEPGINPSQAAPVSDVPQEDFGANEGIAMRQLATIITAKPSFWTQWFWSLIVSLFAITVGVAAWDYAVDMVARRPILGGMISGLLIGLLLVLVVLALKELAAIARMSRIDSLRELSEEALIDQDLRKAQTVLRKLDRLYRARPETEWARQTMAERGEDQFDADGLLGLAENELMKGLDAQAQQEVEHAARQVATVTALVPLAAADMFTALSANLRMIRRVAEIYGGRTGTLGSWRLIRAVFAHLVATGAVAMGDDMLDSVIGGGLLSKLSRRFGEGIINGALTARVGISAMELCRPVPFTVRRPPTVSHITRRALTGYFNDRS